MSLLMLVLMAPLAGFLLILLLPKDAPETVRRVTLAISIAVFGASLGTNVWVTNQMYMKSPLCEMMHNPSFKNNKILFTKIADHIVTFLIPTFINMF